MQHCTVHEESVNKPFPNNQCQQQLSEIVNVREQLFNERSIGDIKVIARSEAEIFQLHGILLDVDCKLWRHDQPGQPHQDTRAFFEHAIEPMLNRNPVLLNAEVRNSGNGLHVLIWFSEPVQFLDESARTRWAWIVKAIQRILPTDPACPGITALTRPVGSVNEKNGIRRDVSQIKYGKPVPSKDVEELFETIARAPFETIHKILFGTNTACPACNGNGRLQITPRNGRCYRCHKVTLANLYAAFLQTHNNNSES